MLAISFLYYSLIAALLILLDEDLNSLSGYSCTSASSALVSGDLFVLLCLAIFPCFFTYLLFLLGFWKTSTFPCLYRLACIGKDLQSAWLEIQEASSLWMCFFWVCPCHFSLITPLKSINSPNKTLPSAWF